MKKITITLCAIALALSAAAQEVTVATKSGTPALRTAAFSWANTVYDFGKIKVGIPASYEFRFTNTGMIPLIVSSVQASCGCTVTAYTKDPVEKGASGFVRTTYNAAKTGIFSKTVTVTANTAQGSVLLTIKGEVVE